MNDLRLSSRCHGPRQIDRSGLHSCRSEDGRHGGLPLLGEQHGKPGGRQRNAATAEAVLEHGAGAVEPPPHRAGRTAQLAGSFFVGFSDQITQHERSAELFRQLLDFLVQHHPHFSHVNVGRRVLFGHGDRLPFSFAAASGIGPGFECHTIGHAEQPAAQRRAAVQRCGSANEHQKGRLKGVVGVVGIGKDSPANAIDHRTVSLDQDFERRLVAPFDEPLEQFAVGKRLAILQADQLADVPDNAGDLTPGHATAP